MFTTLNFYCVLDCITIDGKCTLWANRQWNLQQKWNLHRKFAEFSKTIYKTIVCSYVNVVKIVLDENVDTPFVHCVCLKYLAQNLRFSDSWHLTAAMLLLLVFVRVWVFACMFDVDICAQLCWQHCFGVYKFESWHQLYFRFLRYKFTPQTKAERTPIGSLPNYYLSSFQKLHQHPYEEEKLHTKTILKKILHFNNRHRFQFSASLLITNWFARLFVV